MFKISKEKRSDFIRQFSTRQNSFKADAGWVILSPFESEIKRKVEELGIPLKNWDVQIYRGVLTGFNEAFIINKETRDALIEASPKSGEIIRPILRGRDIKQYEINFGDKWLLFTRRGIDINLYPEVREYLQKHYEQLRPRNNKEQTGRKPGLYQWYEIQDNVAYYKDFEKEKIVWLELTDHPNFALDTTGYYINNTIFFLTGRHLKYILAFLNSRLCEWYFDKIAATSGVGTRRWIKIYIDQIRIPIPQPDDEEAIVRLVDQIHLNGKSLPNLKAIDKEIYNLFSLTEDEIKFIESSYS